MCDFNRISGLIIGAQAAFLASLVIVIAAIALGSNPFTSAANIPAMIVCGALAATATGLLAGALASLDECANGPCGASVANLRTNLIILIASMATYAVAQAALAVIAGIPFAGSAAALALSLWAVSLSTLFAAMASGSLTNTIQAFNACMAQQGKGNNTTTSVIVIASVLVTIAAVIVGASAGVANGTFPCIGPTCKWNF
ncbi:MAG: hypothetical protein RI101_10270 [Nitrospira sp.]|nr:hypothetical protein [Nitrospira sp.]